MGQEISCFGRIPYDEHLALAVRVSIDCDFCGFLFILRRKRLVESGRDLMMCYLLQSHKYLFLGTKRFCPVCIWWEWDYSKDPKSGLFDQAAERTFELFRLLIILFTSVVSFSLIWKNAWCKIYKSKSVNVTQCHFPP